MTDIEEWVKEASGDDSMVAELLLGFKQQVKKPPETEPAPPGTSMTAKPALSVEWTVRQRRSKPVMVQCNNNNKKTKKQQVPRASPTTPLSWTSISGGGVGGGGGSGTAFDGGPEEESSRPSSPSKLSDTPRSKGLALGETFTKRSRKKKSLTELKEQEDLLQNERRQLKRELTSLRQNLEKARATNENLKKMKLDLQPPLAVESASKASSPGLAVSDQLHQKIASIDHIPAILPTIVEGPPQFSPTNGCSKVDEEVRTGKFVLPDLNLPLEEI